MWNGYVERNGREDFENEEETEICYSSGRAHVMIWMGGWGGWGAWGCWHKRPRVADPPYHQTWASPFHHHWHPLASLAAATPDSSRRLSWRPLLDRLNMFLIICGLQRAAPSEYIRVEEVFDGYDGAVWGLLKLCGLPDSCWCLLASERL